MQTHRQAGRFDRHIRYLSAGIVLIAIIIALNWPSTSQESPPRSRHSDPTPTVKENASTSFVDLLEKPSPQKASANFDADTPAPPDTGASENDAAQQNPVSEQSRQAAIKAEYQQRLADLNSLEGNAKLIPLEELWKLAPEVGIDDELLTLLHLSTYDADANVENLARKMLDDLTRYREGKISTEVALVNQINAMDTATQHQAEDIDASLTATGEQNSARNAIEQPGDQTAHIETPATDPLPDMTEQRTEKIAELKALAQDSGNPDTKEYAMNNLMRFDQTSALEVIQYQLQHSNSSEERILAIERLRSVIGDYDNDKIRSLLETASHDYDDSVAENANATLEMLNNYLQPQNIAK